MRYRDYFVTAVVALSVVGTMWGAGCASGGGDGAFCGDHVCDPGEDVWSCSADCSPAVCGDGVCAASETTAACGQDCYCGNATCDIGEDAGSCVLDCGGAICGDDTCQPTENQATCSDDCYCGNATCDQGEDQFTCGADCASAACPDGTCQADETTTTCAQDCWCGNGTCDGGESEALCATDCSGAVCGDGTCDSPLEDASNCAVDCGGGCVDAVCDLWPQCGCSGSQKCSIDSGDARDCMPAGSASASETCTGDADCAAGTICVGPGVGDLLCRQFCVSDADCPGTGGGGVCIISLVDGNDQPIPGADMCTADCNPASTSPVGCPTGWACHLQYVDANADTIPDFFLTDCANDAGTSTTTCDNVTTFCAPGYFCYTDWDECIRTCRMGMSDCQAGMTCYSYADPSIVGAVEYGYCQP